MNEWCKNGCDRQAQEEAKRAHVQRGRSEFRCACGHEATTYETLGVHIRGHAAHGPIPPKLEELNGGGLGVTIGYVGPLASDSKAQPTPNPLAEGLRALEERRKARAQRETGLSQSIFTRAEVLAVLKAQKATWRNEPSADGGVRYRAAQEALDDAIGIFERME